MSDYMFMLESHLNSDQSRVVSEVQAAATQANVNMFLTGGAMRDLLGRFPIVEIDFTVEGNTVKLAQTIAKKTGGQILWTDDNRKIVHLAFPSGVRATLEMARQEKFPKPGAKPVVRPATIHEDLRGRDFTINSIALSLNPASRGLLLDPNNGVGDLERKELRAVSNYTLYDDPIRLLRLLRYKVKLGFSIEERTKMQYDNAREAQLKTRIVSRNCWKSWAYCRRIELRRCCPHARRGKTFAAIFAGPDGRQSESCRRSKTPKGQAGGSLRRGPPCRRDGPVPILPGGQALPQRTDRVREGDRFDAEGDR